MYRERIVALEVWTFCFHIYLKKDLLEQLEMDNKKAKLAVKQIDTEQVSFEKINDALVTDKLRKTNIDEMNDTELREFVKDLIRFV